MRAPIACLLGSLLVPACQPAADEPEATEPFVQAATPEEAGRYLVVVAGCNDCHTPGWMADEDVPESGYLVGTPIGWRGPWGTTYAKNLRLSVHASDEDTWVEMTRTRTSLPPMPWRNLHVMNERDLRAIYRYIASLGPAGEPMPAAVGPDEEPRTPYIIVSPHGPGATEGPQATEGTPSG